MASLAPDNSTETHTSSMDPTQFGTSMTNAALFTMDPLAGNVINKDAANNSLFAADPMAKQNEDSLADNSLFAADPMAKLVNKSLADNSLFAADPMAKQNEASFADNSLFATDPMAKLVNKSLADNSLFAADPMAKQNEASFADNSLFATDPMAKQSEESLVLVDNSLLTAEPMTNQTKESFANNSLFALDPMLRLRQHSPPDYSSFSADSTAIKFTKEDVGSSCNLSAMNMTSVRKDQSTVSDDFSPDSTQVSDSAVATSGYIMGTETQQHSTVRFLSFTNSSQTENCSQNAVIGQPPVTCSPSAVIGQPLQALDISSSVDKTYSYDSSVDPSVEGFAEFEESQTSNISPVMAASSTSWTKDELMIQWQNEKKNLEHNLYSAGQIGNTLLQNNTELKEQLNTVIKEATKRVEDLEQSKYTLQRKLDQKTLMELTLTEEMELLRDELKHQKEIYEETIKADYDRKIMARNRQISCLQNELEQSQLSGRQLKDKSLELETLLQESRTQLDQRVNLMNETSSDDLAQLITEVNDLQRDKCSLVRELSESRHAEEQLQYTLHKAQQQLQAKHEELEEKQCQATAYYNSLEKARCEAQELKVQLDVIRMESRNMKRKGNSLFSEVEDRRVVAEKELISLKVKYESVQNQLKITKQHGHALKTQITLLIQKTGKTADIAHMEQLQREVSCAHYEIQRLNNLVKELENRPQKQNVQTELYEAWSKRMAGSDPTGMSFFEVLLKQKKSEIENLEDKLKKTRFQLLAENQKVLEQESMIYSKGKELEKQHSLFLRLCLRLDEYKMKYESESGTSSTAPVKRNIEKIPMSAKSANPMKENRPVKVTDVRPKVVATGFKVAPDSTTDLKVKSYPRPLADQSCHTVNPTSKKKVSIAEQVCILGDQREPLEVVNQSDVVNSNQTCEGTEGTLPKVKGRPKGRSTHHNVEKVDMDGPQVCKQQ